MKEFFFVPAAVVLIPLAVAAIRQALFSRGCMDGYGYMMAAMLAFMLGGILNLREFRDVHKIIRFCMWG